MAEGDWIKSNHCASARVIHSLNYPHICRRYDVGPNYLVMEPIEGESPKGPAPNEFGGRRAAAHATRAANPTI